ncbi:DUF6350 family protein [Bifidobacterium cuniculi]|uniref:Membrane spanning protein n=1 Tax=Bifidobacterium cuniculi TaxID=1688 RepID=A0A087AW18_9BIFI|nr:DUF6350 family protein [Bifidobacterium cuniculi]KFI62968.1 membrane spanning protein [Bifidobacterium cuniculi]
MDRRLILWAKGAAAPAVAMCIFAVPLGLFMALVLLVVAMEEGGAISTGLAVPLTESLVLLSQGAGFRSGSVTVTITPLLLTMLLVMLIRAICVRFRVRGRTYPLAVLVWVALNALCLHANGMQLQDDTHVVLIKAAAVFTLGFLWATVRHASWYDEAVEYLHHHVSVPVFHACTCGVRMAMWLAAVLSCCGLGAVISWVIANHRQVADMCATLHMQHGSVAVMVIISLAWLPNLVLWGMAWLFGGTFHIGQAASYSLVAVQRHALPSLPILEVFPHDTVDVRIASMLMVIPFAMGLLTGMVSLLRKRGFGLRPWDTDTLSWRTLLLKFTYPAGAFCIASAVLSVIMTLLFLCSDGDLGQGRLASVGVDVAAASNVVSRPSALGLCVAWGIVLVLAVAIYAIRQATHRHAQESSASAIHTDANQEEKQGFTPRTVNSTPQPKEKQGDDESTHTTGLGVRLP